VSDHPLHSAIRRDATLTSEELESVSDAFTEVGHDPVLLADRLKSLGVITQYQFRKIQIGRTSELMFGKFFICERIGEGGMGKVYRALSPDGLEVALKTIRPNLMANKTVVERYKREARAAASLEHPNVVKLIEADDADGRYYIAMEFVNGCDLSRLTKDLIKDSRTIHPSEAAEYIRQAALGLQHSHDRNLIHRDIKPSNLLVCGERALPNTGGKALLKILDMGLVRSLSEEEEGATELTRDGTVVGTPDYMSPEQAKNSSNVDHRADIYSLGCTFYFLLKGGAPFPDGTAIDKLIRHQLDPVPDIRQFRADVSPGLSGVIRKMMSKKPIDRFQSCSEVAKELALYTEEGATFDFGSQPAKPSYDLVDLKPKNNQTPVSSPSPDAVKAEQNQTATATKRRVLKAVNEVKPKVKSDPAAETPQQTERQKLPKPIAKPHPDQNPSGELQGSTAARKPGESKAESIPTKPKRTAATTMIPAATPSKKTKPKASIGWPIIAGAIIGVLAMSGLVVLAVLMANGKTTPSTNIIPPTTNVSQLQPRVAGATLVQDLVPDTTAAVFVVNPKPYWDKLKYETVIGQHLKDYAVMLHRFWNFDPWRFDRITVAFESNPKRFFAIGEGDILQKTEDFRRDLNDIKRLNLVTEADGTQLLREKLAIGTKRDDTRAIFLIKPLAYYIGTPTVNLSDVLKNLRGRANGLKNPRLIMALVDAGNVANADSNDPYLAYFAATGDFQFHLKPGSVLTSLSAHGVEALIAKVIFDGNFRISITVLGTSEKILSTFLEHELPDVFEQHGREEGGKEIAKLIRLATEHSTTGDIQQYKSRTLQLEVDWPLAHRFLAKMIDTPPTTLKK
jgi:eukaryotic-like serine/threonine-protein kinase